MNKQKIRLSIFIYLISIILFNIINYIYFIIYPRIEDWELFSYNFFGSLIFFISSAILFSIFLLILNNKKLNEYLISITLIILLEVSSILIASQSILYTIATTMIEDSNYILIFYPIVILFSYQFCKRVLKIDINR